MTYADGSRLAGVKAQRSGHKEQATLINTTNGSSVLRRETNSYTILRNVALDFKSSLIILPFLSKGPGAWRLSLSDMKWHWLVHSSLSHSTGHRAVWALSLSNGGEGVKTRLK